MHEILETAPRVPLSPNRIFVDGERLARLLDQLRTAIPDEIREAKGVLQQREDILGAAEDQANMLAQEAEQGLNDARQEAEAILNETREKAEQLTEEAEKDAQRRVTTHEIVRRAEERAVKLIEDAQRKADDARADADEYIFDVLSSLENELNRLLAVTRRGRSTLKRATANQPAEGGSSFRRPGSAGPVIGSTRQPPMPHDDEIEDDPAEDTYIDAHQS